MPDALYPVCSAQPSCVGGQELAVHLDVGEEPLAVALHQVVVVLGGEPAGLLLAVDHHGAPHDEPPPRVGGVAVDGDDRVHHRVDGEDDLVLDADEELPDFVYALVAAEVAAVPDGVLDEEAHHAVWGRSP